MSAPALVKGILLSLGVLAALGFAAYENPEVQQWIDEQRRRLADLLRGIGEELDPQSRREAEAFAFQGRTPSSSQHADTATRGETTGTSMPNNTVRRVLVQGSLSQADTEERQRLGREYLAARNQLLRVMRQRRGETTSEETPVEDTSARETTAIKEETPKTKTEQSVYHEAPPLPPKVKLEEVEPRPVSERDLPMRERDLPAMPGSFEQAPEMTYEEQIAHAIALSEHENNLHQATNASASDAYDADVRKAVEASLKDFQHHMAAQSQPVDLMSTDLPGSALGANVWSTEEDLYNVTPNLTRASLAAWDKKTENSATSNNPFVEQTTSTPNNPSVEQKTSTPNNPFVEHETDSFTSWSNAEDSIAQDIDRSIIVNDTVVEDANAVDSDADETGIITPGSWTEVGSIPDESERVERVHA